LYIALGPPLVATKGYGAPEVERVYARARALCQHMGETPQLFPVLRGLGIFYLARADYRTAWELGEQLLTLAQRQQDAGLLLEAHFMLGTPLFYLGELAAARAHLEQGIALYDLKQHRAHAALYGQDTGVACLGFAAWALGLLGYPDQALQRIHSALTLAQELSYPYSLVWALDFGAIIHSEGNCSSSRPPGGRIRTRLLPSHRCWLELSSL
jgi:tetratricopeptide (TPR) repeat protein